MGIHTAKRRPSIREEQKKLTCKRLMSSAQSLFEEHGPEEVTIDQIARHAGTNRSTFYLHFHDIGDISLKIHQQHTRQITAATKQLFRENTDVSREELRDWLQQNAELFRQHDKVVELGAVWAHKKPELMQEFLDQNNEIIERGFKAFLEQFPAEAQERIKSELQLNFLALNYYYFITEIQKLDMAPHVFDIMLERWYSLLSRKH